MKKTGLFWVLLMAAMTISAEPFYVLINGNQFVPAANTGVQDYQGRTQYAAFNVALAQNDRLTCHDGGNNATWHIQEMDSFSVIDRFTNNGSAWVCNVAGTYNIYIKLKYEDDQWYIEESSGDTPGEDPTPSGHYTTSAPAQCPDVILQAFYWDSYQDVKKDSKTEVYGRTKWIDHLNGNNGSSASEIGKWFDLVWLPPMSKSTGGTGYLPVCYSSLDGAWGTKNKLYPLIDTLHQNGARVIADVVLNHVAGSSGWCTFAPLNFGKYGSFKPDASWICYTDEMNSTPSAGACKGTASGAADDGYGPEANYDSGRDWDHTNPTVQQMCKAYLCWLRDEVKIDGFRYDYCKGFHNSHIGNYNTAAEAYFSVMEMWDGNPDVLISHLNDANYNTLTFDFGTKYDAFNNGIAANKYQGLKGCGLLGKGKGRYAVTFLDSHDSFLRDGNEFCGEGNSMTICRDKIMQCYAFLLSMPGVPLVFWPHWVTFKEEIKALINARYKTGVHSESAVSDEAGDGYYKATITGTNGQIRLLVGPNSGYNSTPDGFILAQKGDGYGVYIKMNSTRGDKDKERQPVPQGMEEVTGNGQHVTGEKFIKDGKLYIRCGEQVFDIMGHNVK